MVTTPSLVTGEVPCDRHHGEHEEGRDQRQVGRQLVDERIRLDRGQILLEEQLDAIGEGLEDTEGTGPVGADPVLHVGDELALEPHHQHHADHQRGEGDHDLEQHDQDLARPMSPDRSGSIRPPPPGRRTRRRRRDELHRVTTFEVVVDHATPLAPGIDHSGRQRARAGTSPSPWCRRRPRTVPRRRDTNSTTGSRASPAEEGARPEGAVVIQGPADHEPSRRRWRDVHLARPGRRTPRAPVIDQHAVGLLGDPRSSRPASPASAR